MIKCGVCGSENEAAALFCGTCGSPLSPAEAKAIVDDATKTSISETATPDESVVPGKGGARRDLGIGGGASTVPDTAPKPGTDTEVVADLETAPGGPTITCGVCGTVNDATRTYCRKCANELKPAAAPPPPPPPTPTPRRISPVALALGAGAVVVAIALIGVLVFGGKPGASLAPSAQASTNPSQGVGPSTEPTILPTATARAFSEGALSGRIAFARCPSGGGDCSIFIRPADSSAKATKVIGATGASAVDPSISHDGKKILYVVEPGLRQVTISSGKVVQHSTGPGDTNPDWGPGDDVIAFAGHRDRDSSGDDLEIRTDGISSSVTSTPLMLNDVDDHDPSFTPDGKSIVYVEGDGDGRELKMIDVESKAITDLTTDEFADEDPAVSPDGTEVVFSSKRSGLGGGGEYDLFLLNLATLEITPLPRMGGDEHDPAWSPGGRYIVFSDGADGNQDLFILDLATSSITPFTTADGADLEPSWR